MRLYSKEGYGYSLEDLGTVAPKMSDSQGISTALAIWIDGKQVQARIKGSYSGLSPIFIQVAGRFYRIPTKGIKQVAGIKQTLTGCREYFTRRPQ